MTIIFICSQHVCFFVFSLISVFCVCTFLFGCCYVSFWAAVSAIFSLVVPAICNFLLHIVFVFQQNKKI